MFKLLITFVLLLISLIFYLRWSSKNKITSKPNKLGEIRKTPRQKISSLKYQEKKIKTLKQAKKKLKIILSKQEILAKNKIKKDLKKTNKKLDEILKQLDVHEKINNEIDKITKILKEIEDKKQLIDFKKIAKNLNILRFMIDNIENLIYDFEEKEKLKNKEVESNFQKIGKEKLKQILETNIEKKFQEFIEKPIILKFNFIQLNKKNVHFQKFKFQENYYHITTEPLELKIDNLNEHYNLEIKKEIELISENKKISFLININLHQINNYNIIIDIFEEKIYSLEVVYYSKIEKLLPNIIKFYNQNIYSLDSLPNRKRLSIFNINKKELQNFLSKYNNNQQLNELIFDLSDIFVNVILLKNSIILKVFENEKDIDVYDFKDDEKLLIKEVISYLSNDNNLNFEGIKNIYKKIKKKKKKKILEILKNFDNIQWFIKYFYNQPTNNELILVDKLCQLLLIFSPNAKYRLKGTLKRLNIYTQYKNEYFKKELTLKEKILIIVNLSKFLSICSMKEIIKYELYKMDELPEYSPFIQSEIIYRKIISNLTYESKLSFLYLQLNSGEEDDFITLNSFYKIKMIPLIGIQKHLIDDFIPFFLLIKDIKHLLLIILKLKLKVLMKKKYK